MPEWLDPLLRWYRPRELDPLGLSREQARTFVMDADRAVGVLAVLSLVVFIILMNVWIRLIPPLLQALGVTPPLRTFQIWYHTLKISGAAGVFLIMTHQWYRVRNRRLWQCLAKAGHKICGRCGYYLGGLDDSAACPECGASRLAIQNPRSRARTHAARRPWSPQ